MSIDQILHELFTLPSPTRAFIAEKILESLDYEQAFDLLPEWQAEVQRRVSEIDADTVEMIAARKAFAQIRENFR